jgi:hypothetical protein
MVDFNTNDYTTGSYVFYRPKGADKKAEDLQAKPSTPSDSVAEGEQEASLEGKKVSLGEIVKTFKQQTQALPKNQEAYDIRFKNGQLINQKIQSHNKKAEASKLVQFLHIISLGIYSGKLDEINLESYQKAAKEIETTKRVETLEKELGIAVGVQFTTERGTEFPSVMALFEVNYMPVGTRQEMSPVGLREAILEILSKGKAISEESQGNKEFGLQLSPSQDRVEKEEDEGYGRTVSPRIFYSTEAPGEIKLRYTSKEEQTRDFTKETHIKLSNGDSVKITLTAPGKGAA